MIARRGGPHRFADPLARNTALMAIDLQNALLDDAIGCAVCRTGSAIVSQVNRLVGAPRELGGGVFWVTDTFDPGAARSGAR